MADNSISNGADAIVDVLKAAGVRCIFSLSGNQIMPLYDALLDSGIRLVHVRHEAAAVYMAEAWAQLTGEPGVALVTAGAGFGNALGALISARASETPLILLSGDSPRSQDGMGAFQELDQVAMAASVAKSARRATASNTVGDELAEAIRTARAGRPGPVHLALPVDVLAGPRTDVTKPDANDLLPEVQTLSAADASAVTEFLHGARYPLILAGPASSPTRISNRLAQIGKAFAAPAICMESPRGLRDPSLGAVIELTRQADRILLLGKSADFTTGFLGPDMGAPDAQFAMIDPDGTEIARARARVGERLRIALQADVASALQALLARGTRGPDRHQWLADAADALSRRVAIGETETETETETGESRGMHPARVAELVSLRLGQVEGSVLVVDGGEFGQWAQSIAHDGPRIINGVSGAIGAGPAYAIAASLARPEVPVFALMGDGTAGFLLAEYETAARAGARFVAVIGNDTRWNAEHQIQLRDFGEERTHSCDLSPVARYDIAAAGLGASGEHVPHGGTAALNAALDRALASGKPACVDVRIRSIPAPVVPSRGPPPAAAH
ncbi:thiamine pyrophosphate-binding protein [uncultured Paracoccus sp.]|uniref:thiamine pyrophosphate-binding protein n=1 Tax=uncultured Paracoccus sp. TaxID=189685 RepID=UPI0026328952|nr:thiamine pyrophosphate-binding protein [uncultured Paracoccus sp.]